MAKVPLRTCIGNLHLLQTGDGYGLVERAAQRHQNGSTAHADPQARPQT